MNPATEFELERSYKWLQGKALPRSNTIYEDWASLLGSDKSGAWIAGSSVEAFVDELCTLFSVEREELAARAGEFSGSRGLLDQKTELSEDPVCGTFVGFSWAWSPHRQGQLIQARMRVSQKTRRALEMDYREDLPEGGVVFAGGVHCDGSLLQCTLKPAGGRAREQMAMTLLIPGRPVSVMCGRLQGAILAGPFIRPASTRIVFIRCEAERGGPLGACYLPASAAAIDAELQACLSRPTGGLGEGIFRFLTSHSGGPADQITGEDLAGLMVA
ncbi:hypothetical protein [Pseudooceanicola nanhaiensis]|uniref:hypothetical protein n=1 Tax=Pseudooceanicola nanhaiensis TaxID=375761 RepID=UPI001CD3A400|nr:hypothetical protein [Pseudooceanicola nanhaiensis]MCA0922162.1 hypothetical protein [Pseudooceanicola nanhaiensis]